MPIELDTSSSGGAKIKVIGVGGGGGNAVNNMISKGLCGVDFIAANTDGQALTHNLAEYKIQLGEALTRGLGAGGSSDVGKKAAEESMDHIKELLKGSDMVFVTAGMGGGTGTGGAPVIAKVAQEIGALVVSIVTKPFEWEGKKRLVSADDGINELRQYVDALIVIPNQRLLEIIDKKTGFREAYQKVDEVLYNATRGISDIIGNHGYVNVDFADVKAIMKGMGDALMGIGIASGDNRASEATRNALNSPLLDGISIAGAKGVLVNVTGGNDMTMHEVAEAVSIVEQAAGGDVNLIHGVVFNNDDSDSLTVTVVATGFKKDVQNELSVEEQSQDNKIINDVKLPHQMPVTHNRPTGNSGGGFRPNIAFGGTKAEPHMIKEPAMAASMPSQPYPNSSPKGEAELKKYDTPAFMRRNGGTPIAEKAGAAIDRFRDKPNHTETVAKQPIQNAFLRKMMD